MNKNDTAAFSNEQELKRLMSLAIDRQFPNGARITESTVQNKINGVINRLKEIQNEIPELISSKLSEVDIKFYGTVTKDYLISKRYKSSQYQSFFINQKKSPDELFVSAKHIAIELNKLKKSEFEVKQEIDPVKLDQYAVLAGFEGFNNAVVLHFIPDEVDRYKRLYFDIDQFLKEENIDNPNRNKYDKRLNNPKTEKEFFERYSGYYNVIFIEEGSTLEEVKFGVSCFIIQKKRLQLWYMKYGEKELCLSDFEILADSNRSNFYLREEDNVWGFMACFGRAETVEPVQDGFYFPYLGVQQKDWLPFAGLAYAMKVSSKKDLFLPVRMLFQNSLSALRCLEKPISTKSYNQINKQKFKPKKVYKLLFNNAVLVDSTAKERLKSVCEELKMRGNPIR